MHSIFADITRRRPDPSKGLRSAETHISRIAFVEDTDPDEELHCVTSNLYVGSQDAAHNWVALKNANIRSIINCCAASSGARNAFSDQLRYLDLPLLDIPEQPMMDAFHEAHSFIEQEIKRGGSVLVHCNAGVSRSPTIVASYLILAEKMTVDGALKLVKEARPSSRPNEGFIDELRQLAREC